MWYEDNAVVATIWKSPKKHR